MTKAIAISFAVVLALDSLLGSVALAAGSRSGHSANSAGHVIPFHHRTNRFYPYYYGGYGYGYDYGADYAPPPPAAVVKPAAEKPAAEIRRGCEPQTYSVPKSEGGESQVTILRC